jgi:hypothetical protein
LCGAGEAQQGKGKGRWLAHGAERSRPTLFVAEADIDAEDHPERDPQNGQ